MNITKTSFKTALVLIAVPLFLAGCVFAKNQNTNTDTAVNNTNVSNINNSNTGTTNTNASPTNTNSSNTNEQTNTIDTTDWQTYTNDEYGFSFRHPKEWGKITTRTEGPSEFQSGSATSLFKHKTNEPSQNSEIAIGVHVYSDDFQFIGPTDYIEFDLRKIDLNKSDKELEEILKRDGGSTLEIDRIQVDTKVALRVLETSTDAEGNVRDGLYYMINNINTRKDSLIVSSSANAQEATEPIVRSFTFL